MQGFKRLLFSIALTGLAAISRSQTPTPFNFKNIIPTSPEAAMLGRFGDIPVGPYTGTANIAIPLYSIKEANIEIPIVLRYHSSGIRVEDEASNVGLGWSMEPGGSIIQIVNGRYDGYGVLNTSDPTAYSWLKGSIVTGVYQQRPASEWQCTNDEYMTSGYSHPLFNSLKLGEGEPDIYSYSLPGGISGKFFINPDNNKIIQLDKKEDVKFENNSGNWIATTMDGHKFYFNAVELSSAGNTTGRTSKLTKIVFNTGKEINFEYEDGSYMSNSYSESGHSSYPLNLGALFIAGSASSNTHSTKTLTKISTDDLEVVFELGSRDDIATKRIDAVTIRDKATQQVRKKFVFTYDYHPYTTFGGNYNSPAVPITPQLDGWLGKRLRLLSVREIGYTASNNQVLNPPYEFEYDNTALPYKTSFSRDYWGYYNGKNNSKMVPDLGLYYYAGYAAYQNMPASFLNAGWANRATDKTTITAGILKRVKYPTGGFTDFEYDLHSFSNYDYPDVQKIASVEQFVTVKDQNNTTDPYTTSFSLPRTETIRFTISMQRGPGTSVTFAQMLPSTVTLTKVTGIGTPGVTSTVLKTWQMQNHVDYQSVYDGTGQYQFVEDINLPYQADAVYFVTANMASGIPAQNTAMNQAAVMAQFRYYNIPANGFTSSECGGLRIKSISNYTSAGKFATKKVYKYVKADNTTSGKLLSPLQFLYSKINSFAKVISATVYVDTATIWNISSESSIPYSNGAAGNPIGYSRVEEIEVDAGGVEKGKRIYYYHNEESENHPNVPENPDLQNSLIEKEEVKDNAGNLLTETIYSYDNIEFTYFNGVKLIPTFFGQKPCDLGDVHSPISILAYQPLDEYDVLFYPVNSKWFMLGSKQTKQYENGIVLSTTEEYDYNSKGQLIKSEVYNSKQQKMTAEFAYPVDITPAPSPSTPEGMMLQTNRLNSILSTRQLLNNTETSKTKFDYQILPSTQIVAPVKSSRSINGGTLYEQMRVKSYGDYQRVQQYEETGTDNAILWSDNYNYPVAQISGLTGSVTTQAAYTSFEPNQSVNKGNWTYSGTAVAETGCPSGKNAYNFTGSNNITKSGLLAGVTYVISYWTKNASPFTIAGTLPGYPIQGRQVGAWRYFEHRITGQTSISIGGSGFIDELRLYTLGALMTTRCFDPFYGVTCVSDPNNRINYYEYDAFGRLTTIRDQDKNVIKQICYNYNGQVENCFP